MKTYRSMHSDDKFNWGLKEWQLRSHHFDLLLMGKITAETVNRETKARREAVGLTCKEAEKIVKDMTSSLHVIRDYFKKQQLHNALES